MRGMKGFIGPLVCVALALLVLWSVRSRAPNEAPSKPPAAAEAQGLGARLARGPVLYRWTEAGLAEALDHHGGVWFLQAGGRVYSFAWFERSEYVRPWPAVEGVGTLEGDELFMAYRNATYDPSHDFYHARVHFVFEPDARRFECDFLQQASNTGAADEDLSPGGANGVWVAEPGLEDRAHRERLERMPGSAYADGSGLHPDVPRCAVLPQRAAEPAYEVNYEGRVYRFCCPSCREVFMRRPEAFRAQAGK